MEDGLAQRFAIRMIRDLRSFQGCKNKPRFFWFVFSLMEKMNRIYKVKYILDFGSLASTQKNRNMNRSYKFYSMFCSFSLLAR